MPKRRADGEGTVYKEGGKYRAQLYVGQGTYKKGPRRQLERDAYADLKKLQADLAAGINLAATMPTVEVFMRRWLEDVVKEYRSAATYRSYEQLARLFIYPHLGPVKLNKLTTLRIQQFVNMLRKQPTKRKKDRLLGASTVNRVYQVLRNALNKAIEYKLMAVNPCGGVELPDEPPINDTALTVAQANTLLAAVDGHVYEPVYRVGIAIGARKGEILGLLWDDVDLGVRPYIKIAATLQRQKGRGLVRDDPKTEKSARRIYLPPTVAAFLRTHRAKQGVQAREEPGWQHTGHVFTTRYGTPIEPSNINRHLRDTLLPKLQEKDPDFPDITFHTLRHSAASLMLAAGVSMADVSRLLGHSSVAVTASIYAHGYDEGVANAIDAVDSQLKRKA